MVRISPDSVDMNQKTLPNPLKKKKTLLPKFGLPHFSSKRKKGISDAELDYDKNLKYDMDDVDTDEFNTDDSNMDDLDTDDINNDVVDLNDVDTKVEEHVLDESYGKKQILSKSHKKVSLEASRLVDVRHQLKFPVNLIGDGELDLMLKMDTKIPVIKRIMTKRFFISVAIAVFGILIGIFVRKYFLYISIGACLLSILTWYLNGRNTYSYYAQYSIMRHIAFTTFTRIAGALLPDLADGSNLLSVFDKVSKHMDNQNDRVALEKLMIRMTTDKTDSAPFLEFAHKFSTTDRAELTMIYMHQMYLGNTDTSGLQSLINDTNQDYREQTARIIDMKMRRFTMTTTKIAVSAVIVLFGYFGIYTFNLVSNIFQMMHNVKF